MLHNCLLWLYQRVYNTLLSIYSLWMYTDVKVPVIRNCPANVLAYADRGMTTSIVTWTPPVAIDNLSGTIETTLVEGQIPGSRFQSGQPHSIKYEAVDAAGNKATPCTFMVTIQGEMHRIKYEATDVGLEHTS